MLRQNTEHNRKKTDQKHEIAVKQFSHAEHIFCLVFMTEFIKINYNIIS